jgi:hypothetical protein
LSFFETGSHYVAQAGFELEVLLPIPPKCTTLEYRYRPPHRVKTRTFIC